jgi:lysophospholipase L1-like esterase
MKKFIVAVLGLVMGVGFAWGQAAAPAPASAPVQNNRADLADPTVAAVKLGKNGDPDAGFMKRHEQYLERAKKGNVGLLFLGDSITQGWEKWPKIFDEGFGVHNPANFGIGGDRTQHVLWRIENGELDGIKPKLAVIMIGTNNLSSDDPDKIAEGIEKIVQTTRQKTGAKVLLLGIFPRGKDPADPKVRTVREKIAKINERIEKLDDGGKTIKYLDIKEKFLEPDATITGEVMNSKDYLHLTEEGYKRWAEATKPVIDKMMNE